VSHVFPKNALEHGTSFHQRIFVYRVSQNNFLSLQESLLSSYDLRLSQRWLWRMSSSRMWRCVYLASTDVSEERIAYIFRVEKSASGEPEWAGGCSWRWRRYDPPKRRSTQDLHSATSQKMTFFTFLFRYCRWCMGASATHSEHLQQEQIDDCSKLQFLLPIVVNLF
jgi:hypothetical protein